MLKNRNKQHHLCVFLKSKSIKQIYYRRMAVVGVLQEQTNKRHKVRKQNRTGQKQSILTIAKPSKTRKIKKQSPDKTVNAQQHRQPNDHSDSYSSTNCVQTQ